MGSAPLYYSSPFTIHPYGKCKKPGSFGQPLSSDIDLKRIETTVQIIFYPPLSESSSGRIKDYLFIKISLVSGTVKIDLHLLCYRRPEPETGLLLYIAALPKFPGSIIVMATGYPGIGIGITFRKTYAGQIIPFHTDNLFTGKVTTL